MITKKEINAFKQEIKERQKTIELMEDIIKELIKRIPMPTEEDIKKSGLVLYKGNSPEDLNSTLCECRPNRAWGKCKHCIEKENVPQSEQAPDEFAKHIGMIKKDEDGWYSNEDSIKKELDKDYD
jgi:hypothetical protein